MTRQRWHPSRGPLTRPGPPFIDEARAPGGVVLHVYAVPSGRLLVTRHLVGELLERGEDVDRLAELDVDEAGRLCNVDEYALCLVAYDGDTGERLHIGAC